MTQHSDDDAFTAYVVTRLLPFISKYRMLLTAAGIIMIVLFIVMGIVSMQSSGREQETLNEIYTALTKSKEITIENLEELNTRFGDSGAALEVKWRLAGKYAEQDNYKKAAAVYREIVDAFEDRPAALTAMLALGTCLEHSGKYPDAVSLYEDGRRQYSSHLPIQAYFMYRKAAALHFSGDRAGAEKAAADTMVLLESPAATAGPQAISESFRGKLKDKADFLRNMSRRKPGPALDETPPEEAPAETEDKIN